MLIQSTNSAASVPVQPTASGGPSVVASQTGQSPAASPAPAPTPSQVASEVNRINAALKQANRNVELNISVDAATKQPVVTLKDKSTGDTLLQYPSEAVLAIARNIDEFQQGQLLSRKA